ncbi:MAG: hypothetical protein R3D86_10310 [Emcibacteraceae bacterium]
MSNDTLEDNKLKISNSNFVDQHKNILEMAGYPVHIEKTNFQFDSNEIFAPWERVQVGDQISNSTKKV